MNLRARVLLLGVVLVAVGIATDASNTLQWLSVAPMLERRAWPAGASFDGKLYVFGGNLYAQDQVYYARYVDSIEVFDPATATWSAAGRMPRPVRSATATTAGGKIYIIGGHVSGMTLQEVWAYEPITGTFSARSPMPAPRFQHTAVLVGELIYVFGGTPGIGQDATATSFIYDTGRDAWTSGPILPVARHGLASAVAGTRIYIMGGQNSSSNWTSRADVYDTTTRSWSLAAPMPIALSGLTAVSLHGRVFTVGGGYDWPVTDFAGGFVYDPAANAWAETGPMIKRRLVPGAVALGNAVYAFGGMIDQVPNGWADTANQVEVMVVTAPDNEPPVFDSAPDIDVASGGPGGVSVPYSAPIARDSVDGEVPVTCTPASGSFFVPGTTVVSCTAADASGNAAATSFAIRVREGVAVRLTDSRGHGVAGGDVFYYAGGWRVLGTTDDAGFTNLVIPAGSYTFRMRYRGAVLDKVHSTVQTPLVSFNTVSVAVRLSSSSGDPLDTGTVQVYAAAWQAFGTTAGGEVIAELLPLSYTFRMTYGGGIQDKAQHVGLDPVVAFRTTRAEVLLIASSGHPLDPGTVQYYAGSWRSFGATINGRASRELLPLAYTFRLTYAGGAQDQVQHIGQNGTVAFRTGSVHSDSGSCTSYYAASWRPFAQDMELLPASYPFRFSDGAPDTRFTIAATGTTKIH